MRGSPISRSSSGRSPLPQGSRVTVALTPRSLDLDNMDDRPSGLRCRRGRFPRVVGGGMFSYAAVTRAAAHNRIGGTSAKHTTPSSPITRSTEGYGPPGHNRTKRPVAHSSTGAAGPVFTRRPHPTSRALAGNLVQRCGCAHTLTDSYRSTRTHPVGDRGPPTAEARPTKSCADDRFPDGPTDSRALSLRGRRPWGCDCARNSPAPTRSLPPIESLVRRRSSW